MNKSDKLNSIVLNSIKKKFWSSRSQAAFRGQEWSIKIDDYIEMWMEDDRWERASSFSDGLTFARIDLERGWHLDNVHICTRAEMLKSKARSKRLRASRSRNS